MKKIGIAIAILIASTALAGETNGSYRGNVRSKVFHRSSCQYFTNKNCTATFDTRDAASIAGYRPCKICTPLIGN